MRERKQKTVQHENFFRGIEREKIIMKERFKSSGRTTKIFCLRNKLLKKITYCAAT